MAFVAYKKGETYPTCHMERKPRLGLQKQTELLSACVRPYAFISAAPTGRLFVKFDTGDFYEKSVQKSKILLKSGRKNWTLHDYLSAFQLNMQVKLRLV